MIEMLRQYADKFWERVAKRGNSECWLWTKSFDRYGYGRFGFRHERKKKEVKAHRAAYMLINNCSISSSEFVCHKCDNPACNNPSHLVLGDAAWNIADCVAKGRIAKGSKLPQSKLTEAHVIEIRQRIAVGETQVSLAREFGVARSTIIYALGNGWKHGWKHID